MLIFCEVLEVRRRIRCSSSLTEINSILATLFPPVSSIATRFFLEMSSFFSLTYLGVPGGLSANLAKDLNVSNFSNEEFTAAFKHFDRGTGKIGSEQVRGVFARTYGGNPPESEISSFISCFDLHSGNGDIEFEQFCQAVDKIREERSTSKENNCEYSSFTQLKTDKIKQRRYDCSPQEKYRKSVLASHEYGWYTKTKVDICERHGKKHCPETLFADEMIKFGQIA